MSPRVSRFAAVGLLLVLVLALIFYGIVPLILAYGSNREEIASLEKRLHVMQTMLENESNIDEKLAELEGLYSQGDFFLNGNRAAIASANLRDLVNEFVKKSGGVLVSTQEYKAEPLNAAEAIGLRVQFKGETEHLVDLLHSLESSRPLLFVEKMTVTSSAARKRSVSKRRLSRRAASGSLTVKINVYGYIVTG